MVYVVNDAGFRCRACKHFLPGILYEETHRRLARKGFIAAIQRVATSIVKLTGRPLA